MKKPIKLVPLGKKRRKGADRQAGLAARRELSGVSLKEIADRTRIPLRHLEELERGDVSQWPTGVYAKSWAREYAVEAGLDPGEVVALVEPVAAAEPTIEEIRQVREESERRSMRVRRAFESQVWRRLAAVAVVIALLALAGFFLMRYEPERRSVPQPVGTAGVSPEAPSRAP